VTTSDTYLGLLRQVHEHAGSPSTRTLSSRTGLSHTTVFNILRGRTFPHRRTLFRMLDVLAPPEDLAAKVLHAYDVMDKPARAAGAISPAPGSLLLADRDDSGDVLIEAAQILADALVAGLADVAQAIRDVKQLQQ
jgi:hypothetical protein